MAHEDEPVPTTYLREEVEKIVMDGLEERQTGRGSDGLVRGRESTGVKRTRLAGTRQSQREKETALEERENMTANNSEEQEPRGR